MAENPTPSLTSEQRQRLLNWRPTPNTPAKDRLNQRIQQQAQGVGLDDQSFGNFAAIQQAKGNFTDQEIKEITDAMGPVARDSTLGLGKGLLVGTAAGAADIFGMLQALAEPPAIKLAREGGHLPDLVTGNTIRNLVDLDPNDAFGMIGEVFSGGLEALVAKAPVIGAKVFGTLATNFPELTFATIMGPMGVANLRGQPGIALMESAVKMLDEGVNPATVMKKTGGWYRDKTDGMMKIAFSDSEAYIDSGLIQALADNAIFDKNGLATINTTIGKALVGHPTLLKAYPQLADMPLHFSVARTAKGEYKIFDPDMAKLGVNGQRSDNLIEIFNDSDGRLGRTTLLHEIQHQIQAIEGFAGGANRAVWENAITRAKSSSAQATMMKQVINGNIPEAVTEEELVKILTGVFKRSGIGRSPSAREVGLVRGYLDTDVVDLERELNLVRQLADKDVRIIGTMLNELGRKADDASIETFLKQDQEFIRKTVSARYRNQGGEVEARIVQFLEDKTQAEIDAIGVPLNELAPEVGTPLDEVIRNKVVKGRFPDALGRLFDEMNSLEKQLADQIPMNKLLRVLEQKIADRPFPKLESLERKAEFARIKGDAEAERAANDKIIDRYQEGLEDAMRLEMDKIGIPERLQEDIIEGIIPRPDADSMKIIDEYLARIEAHIAADNPEAAARLESELIDILQSKDIP